MSTAIKHYKASGLDLSTILYKPENGTKSQYNNTRSRIRERFDFQIIKEAIPSIYRKEKTRVNFKIKNTDRSVGAILSNEISKIYVPKVYWKTLFLLTLKVLLDKVLALSPLMDCHLKFMEIVMII
jgi:hypothetical protein